MRIILILLLAAVVAGVASVYFMTAMPLRSYSGPLKPLSDEQKEIRDHLRQHVDALAVQIGERNIENKYASLESAAQYIEDILKSYGYTVVSQPYSVRGVTVRNLAAELPGTAVSNEVVIIGAHYDSALGSPAANDNASGVAALLELARLLRNSKPTRTTQFVFFVNEEPPYFQTSKMGSLVYARSLRQKNLRVAGMISLETIGSYYDAPHSQHYPPGLGLFYPDTANFIAFVGNTSSRGLVRRAVKAFREHADFPSEGTAAPGDWIGVGWSDHWSFWQEGYPAIMVTDTALFRYRYYHTVLDTPDRVDFDKMARVVSGLEPEVLELATTGQQ